MCIYTKWTSGNLSSNLETMYNSGKGKSSKTAIKETIQKFLCFCFFFTRGKFKRYDAIKAMIFKGACTRSLFARAITKGETYVIL